MFSDETPEILSYITGLKTERSSRVFTKCTHTSNGIQTLQLQFTQLTAFSYHHAEGSISYNVAITDCQFFQMYASVNKTEL